MKRIFLLLLMLSPVSSWAAFYVQASTSPSILATKVWIEVQDASTISDPFRTVDPQLTSLVVGGGLLLWGIGCGVGMFLNQSRKMR